MFFQLQQHPGELRRRPRERSVEHLEQSSHVTQPRSQPLLSDQTMDGSTLMSQRGRVTFLYSSVSRLEVKIEPG